MKSKLFSKNKSRNAVVAVSIFAILCNLIILPVKANAVDESFYSSNDILFYDPNDSQPCSTTNNAITAIGTDYLGKKIINDAQESAIAANKTVYEQAANDVDVPWQLIAVTHLRETGLKRENPGNGQGIYQFYDKHGGPYPTGEVSDAEFLRQTKLAAEFLKEKADSNLPKNKNLTKNASADTVKDTLFSYNGRAGVYKEQAVRLGFNGTTQPFEGSPYVMNRADKQRDPEFNTTTWGQIKVDNGGIDYPANGDYGAFVIYSAIAGIQGSTCAGSSISGTILEKVMTVATRELELWDSKQLTGDGSDFKKYTYGQSGNWCAWFVSWIYKQAGYPLTNSKTGEVASVSGIWDIGKRGVNFEYHDKANYTPRVGDMVIKKNGASHVNIVVAVEPDGKMTTVGGNQGYGSSAQAITSFRNSLVTSYSQYVSDDPSITGFVSPKGI